MEGWEIRRRDARFRGIPLELFGATRAGGRRISVHEFARREEPFAEDLGRSARSFSIRGATIGADHDLEADRLEAAFEKAGPGELVLPHRAPIMVAVRSYSIEEPDRLTRIQRFSVEFVEAGTPTVPTARPNTAGIVQTKVEEAIAAIRESFSAAFTISDQTKAAIDRTVELTDSAVALVSDAFVTLKAAADAVEEVAEYASNVATLANRISGQIVDAAIVAREFQSAIDDLLDLPFAPLDVYRQLESVAKYGADLVDGASNTVARRSFKRNQDSLFDVVQHSATVTRAKALSLATFETATEAAEFRDEIATELSAAIVAASDALADDTVVALRAVRTSILRDLDSRSARLPARVIFETPLEMPSLVVAQRLYADPTRELEIVARNPTLFRNPGRIPRSSPLEVLGVV